MPLYTDQMNRVVDIPSTPKRIVSIVPSQTELLFDFGLNEEVIGITKFCIHPADKVKQKFKIGGTKTLDIGLIKQLDPDLIIGNKEENEKEQVEELMQSFPVWMSDITDLDDAVGMITQIGEIVGRTTEVDRIAETIRLGFRRLTIQPENLKVAYLIWRKPYIAAGKGTFIDTMLQTCGLTNVFVTKRYPEVSSDELQNLNPDVILLSSEPYPFKEKHIAEFKSLLPGTRIKLVDGELFSWYGSRLLRAPEYFQLLADELKISESEKNRCNHKK